LTVEEFEELPVSAEAVLESPTSGAVTSAEPEPEVIRERYDNRRVKLEREVVQDAEQNYINHGKWKMWDPEGNIIVEGRYEYNERGGVWTRIYRTPEVKLLTIAPFRQGQLPLVSQANFKDGKLHGKWVIYDANKR
jgi:antitoxin component YwqK of YwqJK toxin-antitoxin module